MKKIAVIPIDNRPICYNLIADIAAIDKNIELFLPKREHLGDLKKYADTDELFKWLSNLEDPDYLVLSLDTIAYGGLISSRRTEAKKEEILEKIKKLENIIEKKKCKVYAFSSIMRISNNNVNEEEKEYWNLWGKKIFEYSYFSHKTRREKTENCVINQVPKDILEDYLNTRKRNFEINLYYIDLLKQNIFDFLVFSKDDCAKYGLNVEEAEILEAKIKESGLNAKVKTGADEIPLLLLSRALTDNKEVKIAPKFLCPNSINLISKYEDLTVFDCVKSQIELSGAMFDEKNPDLILVVNNFGFEQGDYVLGEIVNKFEKQFKMPDFPYFIADINNANGADNVLVKKIFNEGLKAEFYGFCGYNTSANTIGCAIFVAITKFSAKNYDDLSFRKLQFIRFMDDYAYQANIRQSGGQFKEFEKKINAFLKTEFKNVKFSYPWKRSFEIEITV